MENESNNCYSCKNHGKTDLSGMVDWCRHYRIYLHPRDVIANECDGFDPLPEF